MPLVAVAVAATAAMAPLAADPGQAMPGSAGPAAAVGVDLGMVASPASDVLCEQLALEAGTGLVVDAVADDSIAARAGIRRHDVLVSLDDRPLVAASQLVGLLEPTVHEPPLRCRLVRGGSSLAVRLPVRLPPGWARGDLQAAASRSAGQRRPAVRGRVGLMMRVADEALLQQDPDFHIKVTRGVETRLFVRDARGMTVYNGPIDTPEQRSLVPIAVRERVERMERLLAVPATGDRGSVATDSARPAAHETTSGKALPERTASHAEIGREQQASAPIARERRLAKGRPADGERPDVEIGRLDIEPVEIR